MDSLENEFLPEMSKHKYKKVYDDFLAWRASNKVREVSEDVIMTYFNFLHSQKLKPTSLWAYYSMLKATIKLNENIDISAYQELSAFLKAASFGYKPTKAQVFTKREIDKFITDAPDNDWLDVKVACIFGVLGALRTEEMTRILITDIEKHGELFLVRISKTKTHVSHSFTISGKFYDIVRKYAALRSPRTTDPRFFVNYQNGKCTIQVIGKNKFGKMAERIALFLELPDPKRFTGHSFRRSSIERTKRHGSWLSLGTDDDFMETQERKKQRTETIPSPAIPATETSSTAFDPPIIVGVKSEPIDICDMIESTFVKTEPLDQQDMTETNASSSYRESESTEWLPSQQGNSRTSNIANDAPGSRRIYKCEQCGHLNAIASDVKPALQDGFFDSSQSIENSSMFQVSIDPLSFQLHNNPLNGQ